MVDGWAKLLHAEAELSFELTDSQEIGKVFVAARMIFDSIRDVQRTVIEVEGGNEAHFGFLSNCRGIMRKWCTLIREMKDTKICPPPLCTNDVIYRYIYVYIYDTTHEISSSRKFIASVMHKFISIRPISRSSHFPFDPQVVCTKHKKKPQSVVSPIRRASFSCDCCSQTQTIWNR